MIDRNKPLRFPELQKVGRDPYRLEKIHEVRLENDDLKIISNEKQRVKLLFLSWGKINDSFGAWLKTELYNNPNLFNDLALPSADTILKDNREMERKGFWEKPEAAKIQAPTLDQATA